MFVLSSTFIVQAIFIETPRQQLSFHSSDCLPLSRDSNKTQKKCLWVLFHSLCVWKKTSPLYPSLLSYSSILSGNLPVLPPMGLQPRKATCLQDNEWWETGIPASGGERRRVRPIFKMKLRPFCSLFSSTATIKWTLAMRMWASECIDIWVPGPSAATPMEMSRHSAAIPCIVGKALPPSSCVHCPFLSFHKPTHSLSHILLNSSETLSDLIFTWGVH